MADEPKAPAVWVHHPPSGRTQRVSAAAWAAGDLAADGWGPATDDQVAVVTPSAVLPPVPDDHQPPPSPRSRRGR